VWNVLPDVRLLAVSRWVFPKISSLLCRWLYILAVLTMTYNIVYWFTRDLELYGSAQTSAYRARFCFFCHGVDLLHGYRRGILIQARKYYTDLHALPFSIALSF